MDKHKVLFVVDDFYRAGAERFAYEIDRALDKNRFEITILSITEEISNNSSWNSRYYDRLHKDLSTRIEFIDSFQEKESFINRVTRRVNKKLFNKKSTPKTTKINHFFSQFDVIHWFGEYTFFHSVPMEIKKKSLIHSMTAKFQNPNLYKRFDFNFNYNFISPFDNKECDYEYSEFKNINYWHLPLLLKLHFQENKWKFKKTPITKIGIFTRLDIFKPLDPFFYSFQLLLEKLPNCELHIYGNGDPEKEGMIRYLKTLGIREKVFFRGHQENIVETAMTEHINLSWFQGYNNDRPAGYAGFDICSTGTPLICWDFLENPNKPFNEVYPHYKSLTKFVEKSFEILTNEVSANKLSETQFNDVLEKRDVYKHIRSLEEIYCEIIETNK